MFTVHVALEIKRPCGVEPPSYGGFRSLSMKTASCFGCRGFVIPVFGILTFVSFGGAFCPTNAAGAHVINVCNESELRQAVKTGGTIQFGCSGIITLSGPIDIAKDVTLDGAGMAVTISGGNAVQLFNMAPHVTFEVRHLTLADGWHQGTNGLHVGSEVDRTGEAAFGGAIYNAGGTLRLVSCILSNNAALYIG